MGKYNNTRTRREEIEEKKRKNKQNTYKKLGMMFCGGDSEDFIFLFSRGLQGETDYSMGVENNHQPSKLICYFII